MEPFELNLINHFTLNKHHLTNDSKIDDIIQIASEISGLHATMATTPYLSLFARTEKFQRRNLDREVYEKRSLGKVRFVRKTMYLLPKQMIPLAFSAMNTIITAFYNQYLKNLKLSEKHFERLSDQIQGSLKQGGLTTKEIKSKLDMKANASAILNIMCDQGILIRETIKKSWKSNLHNYYLFNEYFSDIDLDEFSEIEAQKRVILHYLSSFGPVTQNDITWWTGFTKGKTIEILENIQKQLYELEIMELDGPYHMLKTDLKKLTTFKVKNQNIINILPCLDSYLMGYKDRERYLDLEQFNFIFDRSGNVTSTILLNGRAIGIWDSVEKPEAIVKLYFFREVNKDILKEVQKNAKKVGEFIFDREVRIKECDSMVPLDKRTAGGFMTPLEG